MVRAELAYDNTKNSLFQYWGSKKEFGDEVTLATDEEEDPVLTKFTIETFGKNLAPNATGVLRFYENDGIFIDDERSPGNLLFESVRFPLSEGANTVTLSEVSVDVPQTFTWTVGTSGIGPGDFGLTLFNPVAVGNSKDHFWIFDEEKGWDFFRFSNGKPPGNFAAKIEVESRPQETKLMRIKSTGSRVTLTVKGEPYQPYLIQVSDDLSNWRTISAQVSRTGTIRVEGQSLDEGKQRYYRAVEP